MKLVKVLAALGAAVLGLSSLSAPLAHAETDPNKEALTRLGACLSGSGTGDMLLLMDQSASLKRTDPKGARVDAAKYVVRQMSSVAETYHWKLNVAVAGFDTRFSTRVDWTPLNPGTVGGLESNLEGFRGQNDGLDTDYWAALDSARRELGKRSATTKACSFIVWFSDGELSIEPRKGGLASDSPDRKPYMEGNLLGTKELAVQAEQKAKADLCRQGGVADQTRSDNVLTLAVGLSTADSKPDFTLLKGIATGTGMSCGAITSPAPGAFFTADGIDQMLQAFDQIASPGAQAIQQESEVCSAGAICPNGTHQFVLDASIAAVHALATTGAAGQKVVVVGPAGDSVELAPGGSAVSKDLTGAKVTASWLSDRSISIDLKRSNDQGWIGKWGMAFVAPGDASGKAQSSLHIYGDLLPAAVGLDAGSFSSGNGSADIKLGLQRADGSNVDPASVSSAVKMDAELVQKDVTVPIGKGIDKGALGTPLKADLTKLQPGEASLRLTLNVTTASWASGSSTIPGTTLEPQSRDYPITILPPASYPQLQPEVDFGTTDEIKAVTAKVKVNGAGCVWLDKANKVTSPDGLDNLVVTSSATSKESCVSGELPLSIDVKAHGSGLLSGNLQVLTLPESKAGNPVPASVKYRLDVLRPMDIRDFLVTLIGVTVAGIAIPVGFLYLIKFLTSSIPGESIASATVRGAVSEGSSFLAGGVPITVQDLKTTVLTGGSRRKVTLQSGQTLIAKTGLAPTEGGFVVVDQPGVAAGGRRAASSSKGKARLPLAVQGNWSVALDPVDPRNGDVAVTVFTAPGGAGLTELLEDVRTNIVEWVSKLRSNLPQSSDASGAANAASASADPWGAPAASSGDAWDTTPSAGTSAFGGSTAAQPGTPPVQDSNW